MNDFPVPLQILDKSSQLGKLFKNHNLTLGDFKILVGENRGPLMLDMDMIGHLIVSGWAQSGKETILDAMIQSIMLQYKPEEARLILFDAQADLSQYSESNPYLLTDVIHDWDKVISALKWTLGEMQERYKQLRIAGFRNFYEYNMKASEKKPRIVFFIKTVDEAMSFAPGEVENNIIQIIEKGRNVGIHLVIVTNKISKANIPPELLSQLPNRIICQTTSEGDSITAGAPGAHTLTTEQFYLLLHQEKPVKFPKVLINKQDILNIKNYLKKVAPKVSYTQETASTLTRVDKYTVNGGENDVYFNQAVEIIMQQDKASASLLQRRLSIGYARAARLLDQLEAAGYLGPAEGAAPRQVIRRAEVK